MLVKNSPTESPVEAKIVAMCVLFLVSFTLGLVPMKLFKSQKVTKNNSYVNFLLCFGGGVLLATTFLHLLPEVTENLAKLNTFEHVSLPMPELLMCTGFFAMFLVEECVHYYLERRERATGVRHSVRKSAHDVEANHQHVDHSHEDHSHVVIGDATIASIRGLLVVLALSIHELFEGLSVGLEASPAHVWYMFGAVSAHKFVIAFCIGVELVTSGMRTALTIVYIFTFAVVSPMGIAIGIGVSADDEAATALPSAVLQGLATGTLLYVVFFEILKAERKTGLLQFCAILIGFCVMTAITTLE